MLVLFCRYFELRWNMQAFLAGLAVGVALGIALGLYIGRFPEAVQATGIGFGAGLGIFTLGALVRYVAGFTDKAFAEIKEGKKL
jgi:purine-cytosine permease-like protein